jgi:futalosine hydrolase
MFLVTAATAFEMEAFAKACGPLMSCEQLLTGIGPVEAAVQLTAYLASSAGSLQGVINMGVAGAYVEMEGADLLDICLAETEVLGDLGICTADGMEPLRGAAFEIVDTFDLDQGLRQRAAELLRDADVPYKSGIFVTVNCVSGSRQRGVMLARQHSGLCENMEGAAVARACQQFGLPLLEVRCISNLVTDRDLQKWQLKQACARCGEVVALVLRGLQHV